MTDFDFVLLEIRIDHIGSTRTYVQAENDTITLGTDGINIHSNFS